jgi:hypothetical protein
VDNAADSDNVPDVRLAVLLTSPADSVASITDSDDAAVDNAADSDTVPDCLATVSLVIALVPNE